MFPNRAIIRNNNGDWLTLADAADLAGVARATAWRWVRLGRLPARRRGLRTLEVPRAAIEALREPESAADRLATGLARRVGRATGRRQTPAKGGPWRCPADSCGAAYGSPAELAAHLVGVHGPPPGKAGRPPREGPAPRCRRRRCNAFARARGLCWKHYQAARRAHENG